MSSILQRHRGLTAAIVLGLLAWNSAYLLAKVSLIDTVPDGSLCVVTVRPFAAHVVTLLPLVLAIPGLVVAAIAAWRYLRNADRAWPLAAFSAFVMAACAFVPVAVVHTEIDWRPHTHCRV